MHSILRISLGLVTAATLSACVMAPVAPAAPQPAQNIDASRFYTGRWYEIGRTPMRLTDGCVAGTTDYTHDGDGKLREVDACHDKTPAGKSETIQGQMAILNPGENNKTLVHYRVFHIFTVSRTYWILDRGKNYDWFIETDPGFQNMSIFTRSPRPSSAEVNQLTQRARAMGYDISKLEYPAQFPPGAG
jgi:apolipoprotein D and lipocalin family protein